MNSTGGWERENIYESLVYKYAESEMCTSLSMIMFIGTLCPSYSLSVCRDDNVLEIETWIAARCGHIK